MVSTLSKKAVLLTLFLFLSFIICGATDRLVKASSQTIAVSPGQSIQEAITNANAGDTILVNSGLYYEKVIVNKAISLIGVNSSTTFIDGGGGGNVLTIISSNVLVKGFTIQNGGNLPMPGGGVQISGGSTNVLVCDNVIKRSYYGIRLFDTYNNNISYNIIINNYAYGFYFSDSSNNRIVGNIIANHSSGVSIATETSKFNILYHNNFINNTNIQIFASTFWDDGYPSGGNYWSDYTGVDEKSGPNQNEPGKDGIGDTPYPSIDQKWDRYPLIGPITMFNAGAWFEVTYYISIISNSTVSHFNFNPDEAFIRFNVSGLDDTTGFSRVAIPKQFLWVVDEPWTVLVGDQQMVSTIIPNENYTYFYLTYNFADSQSTKIVKITGTYAVPELSVIKIFPLFIAFTLILVILTKRLQHNSSDCCRMKLKSSETLELDLNITSRFQALKEIKIDTGS